jgi:hypothetical protein
MVDTEALRACSTSNLVLAADHLIPLKAIYAPIRSFPSHVEISAANGRNILRLRIRGLESGTVGQKSGTRRGSDLRRDFLEKFDVRGLFGPPSRMWLRSEREAGREEKAPMFHDTRESVCVCVTWRCAFSRRKSTPDSVDDCGHFCRGVSTVGGLLQSTLQLNVPRPVCSWGDPSTFKELDQKRALNECSPRLPSNLDETFSVSIDKHIS